MFYKNAVRIIVILCVVTSVATARVTSRFKQPVSPRGKARIAGLIVVGTSIQPQRKSPVSPASSPLVLSPVSPMSPMLCVVAK